MKYLLLIGAMFLISCGKNEIIRFSSIDYDEPAIDEVCSEKKKRHDDDDSSSDDEGDESCLLHDF